MMKTKRIELSIASHLVTALINADESGLIDEDIKAIDKAIKAYGPYFHVYMPDQEEPSFQRCDICRLMADCCNCLVEVSDGQ